MDTPPSPGGYAAGSEMTITLAERTEGPPRLLAVALAPAVASAVAPAVVLACVSIALALTASPS